MILSVWHDARRFAELECCPFVRDHQIDRGQHSNVLTPGTVGGLGALERAAAVVIVPHPPHVAVAPEPTV